ncbi:hypothetical protein [Fodinicola feengrottensis]|uniref:hypothetical protein n=1 Tax=Fodinicola feengrottensis TaxID=435914 RepID=UPI0024434BE8|nr:hypothetical protein [Fodinicola feengrottensis]
MTGSGNDDSDQGNRVVSTDDSGPAVAAAEDGRLIAGRYRLRTWIGAGAMGEVWQAMDERLHRIVAAKAAAAARGTD